MKKIITTFAVLITIITASQAVYADDWRSDFQKTFEGTPVQQTDEKLRSKFQEFKDSGKIEETKEKAKEIFGNTKDWVTYKYSNHGKHTYPAQGFELSKDKNFTDKIDEAYLTVKIGTVKNTLYFSDRDGNPLVSFYWNDLATTVKYRFQQITANGKIQTKGLIETFTGKNLFPNNSYYVWAEVELSNGEKIFRPVPVAKEDFKTLKKAEKGVEFTPLFEK